MYHEIIYSSMLNRKLGHSVATASGYYLPPETSPLVDPIPERYHSQPLNVPNFLSPDEFLLGRNTGSRFLMPLVHLPHNMSGGV